MKKYFAGVILGIAGIWAVAKLTGTAFSNTLFNFKGVKWYGFSAQLNRFCFSVLIEIDNRNAFDFPRQSFDGLLTYKGRQIAEIKSSSVEKIEAREKKTLNYLVPIDINLIKNIATEVITQRDNKNERGLMLSDIRIEGDLILYTKTGQVAYTHRINEYVSFTIDRIF